MSLKSILKTMAKGTQLPDNYITKITKDNFEDYFGDADTIHNNFKNIK